MFGPALNLNLFQTRTTTSNNLELLKNLPFSFFFFYYNKQYEKNKKNVVKYKVAYSSEVEVP